MKFDEFKDDLSVYIDDFMDWVKTAKDKDLERTSKEWFELFAQYTKRKNYKIL